MDPVPPPSAASRRTPTAPSRRSLAAAGGDDSAASGRSTDERRRPRIEPFVPRTDCNPTDLISWARRTGYNPNLSGEGPPAPASPPAAAAAAAVAPAPDIENGLGRRPRATPEIEPILGARGERGGGEIEMGRAPEPEPAPSERAPRGVNWIYERIEKEERKIGVGRDAGVEEEEEGVRGEGNGVNGNVSSAAAAGDRGSPMRDVEKGERELELEYLSETESPEEGEWRGPRRRSGLRCGLTDNPGYAPLIFYGLQHYLSLAGSLVFIPLIMVPVMGGTDEETATVISTMLLVSGLTTILHSFFGTRLPLVQGSSFVYLAPALVIINSEEFRNLSENKFKHIMRELQGAIIVGSVFQTVLGYSGLMSLLLRLINPVVVAPTVAAVGLAFFSYGFPQAGTCLGISIPQIILVLIFTLYLRRVSLFGHRVFLVYAVPLSVAIVWAYAFFLTAGGAYKFKGCNSNIPSSNILLDACRKHADTLKHCRTDVSSAWRTAAWVRVPYPFQWGSPIFHMKTSVIMIFVSLVASVDSAGTYHVTSLLINQRTPSPGIVSRGIGLEGCSSILAGMWGTGTGSTTLTENIHTIDVTKMASRKAVELGAAILILFSVVGKVGALLASIPLALAASVLCFTWALIVALGLSTLQYTQSASSRNIIIVGFTLFISLSIPAYAQQYQPKSSLILPSYLLPYAAGSSGPVHSGSEGFDFVLNSLLSLNMVVALVVAFVLDNTVPGSRQERGVYIWSDFNSPNISPSSLEPYMLPEKIGRYFRWVKWVGS